jgi:hypothetical protein
VWAEVADNAKLFSDFGYAALATLLVQSAREIRMRDGCTFVGGAFISDAEPLDARITNLVLVHSEDELAFRIAEIDDHLTSAVAAATLARVAIVSATLRGPSTIFRVRHREPSRSVDFVTH